MSEEQQPATADTRLSVTSRRRVLALTAARSVLSPARSPLSSAPAPDTFDMLQVARYILGEKEDA